MNTLTKTILAAGLAIVSSSAFACAENPYEGNFSDGTKTISVYETERCSGHYVFREWAPDQKPTMREGRPMLKLFSIDTPDYGNIHFKRRNGQEYVLSIPEGAYDSTYMATRINLDIRKDGESLNSYTLKRIGN